MFQKKKKQEKSYFELVNEALIEQNKKGYMDINIENELYNSFSNNNYVLGIHKTGLLTVNG